MSEKITGYALLGAGILMMLFSAFQIVQIFTGKSEPLPFFSRLETQEDSTLTDTNINPTNLLDSLKSGKTEGVVPKIEIIDPKTLGKILDLLVYYLIMQFLMTLGYKFASLGVQILKPVKVVLQKSLEDLNKSAQENKSSES